MWTSVHIHPQGRNWTHSANSKLSCAIVLLACRSLMKCTVKKEFSETINMHLTSDLKHLFSKKKKKIVLTYISIEKNIFIYFSLKESPNTKLDSCIHFWDKKKSVFSWRDQSVLFSTESISLISSAPVFKMKTMNNFELSFMSHPPICIMARLTFTNIIKIINQRLHISRVL